MSEALKARAAARHQMILDRFAGATAASIKSSKIYKENSVFIPKDSWVNTHTILADNDSVVAIDRYSEGRTAVLNFASFRNPGGGYMQGMMAQEEALCFASNLYEVLSNFEDYYEENRKDLNGGMYYDRAIYSPDIIFMYYNKQIKCDVITCAAPNLRNAQGDRIRNHKVLVQRAHFINQIAEDNNVDTLILGAYGCGVFRQNPYEVAEIFKDEFKNTTVKKIVYAVPANLDEENYYAFEKVLNK